MLCVTLCDSEIFNLEFKASLHDSDNLKCTYYQARAQPEAHGANEAPRFIFVFAGSNYR